MIEQQQINNNNSSQNYNNISANNNYSQVKIQSGNHTQNISAINRLKEKTSKLVQITYNNNTNNTNVVQINNYKKNKDNELKSNTDLGKFFLINF